MDSNKKFKKLKIILNKCIFEKYPGIRLKIKRVNAKITLIRKNYFPFEKRLMKYLNKQRKNQSVTDNYFQSTKFCAHLHDEFKITEIQSI